MGMVCSAYTQHEHHLVTCQLSVSIVMFISLIILIEAIKGCHKGVL